jgi:ribonuclease HI
VNLTPCPYFQQMNPPYTYHIGYAYGVIHWTNNLSSMAWGIYTPDHVFLQSSGTCLCPATNNQVEYATIMGILSKAIHLCIHHLNVLLDSHLIFHQLNKVYCVCDPCLFVITYKSKFCYEILSQSHLLIYIGTLTRWKTT